MRPFNPLQRFALLTILCVAALCLALAFAVSYLLELQMREVEWQRTADIVRYEVERENLAPYFTDVRRRREPARYRAAFSGLLGLPEVVRLKVWDREATVLWSDDERLIGRRFPENLEVQEALAGRVSVALKTLDKPEHTLERERFTRLAEIYVPITSQTTGDIIGIVEVYELPSRLFAAIRTLRLVVWGIVICGGILFYVALLRSYRKQLELERSLREYSRHLEKASRHKSEFLASISHELRTPMNSVIGFSEMLRDLRFGPLNEKQREHVGHILSSARHLLSLINDLLDLSRVEAGKFRLHPEPFVVHQAVEAVLTDLQAQVAAKDLKVVKDVDPALPLVTADPVRVKQILYNLLSNAVKFTPAGGAIGLVARRATTPPPPVAGPGRPATDDRALSSEAGTVEIAVTDTGIGVKAGDLPKLFQPFVQLEEVFTRQHPGTGLGLAVTKQLVELHGGQIWADSPGEGKGSTFTIRLPLVPRRLAAASPVQGLGGSDGRSLDPDHRG